MRLRFKHLICYWFICAVVAGCTPRPDAMLDDYVQRLERVTATTIEFRLTPRPRQLEGPTIARIISDNQVSLLDLLSLRPCGLDTLLAERNSPLGKVMRPSVALRYEMTLLEALPGCLRHPALSVELRQQLQVIYQQKLQQMPTHFALFLATDETLVQQLLGSQRMIALTTPSFTPTLEALQQLQHVRTLVANQQFAAATQVNLEAPLAVLYQSQIIADLYFSLNYSADWLQAMNNALNTIPSATLCRADPNIRDTLLREIFIQRVQQYFAHLDNLTHAIVPALQNLYQNHPWQDVVSARFIQPQQQLHQALKQHVQFYKRWQQCDTIKHAE